MDLEKLASLAKRERGVLSLAELHAVRVSSATITNRVKSGIWSRPLHGVYFVWPGLPDFSQKVRLVQKWSGNDAIVFSGQTAAYLHGLRAKPPERLEVIVPARSALRSNKHVTVRRTRRLLNASGSPRKPPLDEILLDLIDAALTQAEVLELLIKAIQKHMEIGRFVEKMNTRSRLRHRRYLQRILEITDLGVESHLELAYLRNVERAHELPHSYGQKRERIAGRWIRSDRWYQHYRVRTELHGELAHPGRATDDDVMRDNEVRLVLDEITLRFRWQHVTLEPCRAAAHVTRALHTRGWTGTPTTCSPTCTISKHLIKMGHAG